MPPASRDQEMKRWADDALGRLTTLTAAVASLRAAFDSGAGTGSEQLASNVLAASLDLTQWIATSRAPRGLRKAEGELGATAGVYRNAAVAFESLADADPDRQAARSDACVKLLDQGDHHIEVLASILNRKGLAV